VGNTKEKMVYSIFSIQVNDFKGRIEDEGNKTTCIKRPEN